jgi:hypothetical protein
VRCDDIDLDDILSTFSAKIATFTGKYLGLPLHFGRLRKVDLQPLIDKIAAKLTGWMGKNLARSGRVTLARTVLMATAVYHATVIPLSNWARHKIIYIARRFVWAGDAGEHDARGHALVNWKTVCRPENLGGLRIPDLERSGRALRLRWLWLQWTYLQRPWSGSKLPINGRTWRSSGHPQRSHWATVTKLLSGTTIGVTVALFIYGRQTLTRLQQGRSALS